jgi:hypothetical protein
MADFDCVGSYWDCHKVAAAEAALNVIPALVIWGGLGWLLARERNKF